MNIFSMHPYNQQRNFYFLDKDKMKIILYSKRYFTEWEKKFIDDLNINYYQRNKKVTEKQYNIFNKLYNKSEKNSALFEELNFIFILKKILNEN